MKKLLAALLVMVLSTAPALAYDGEILFYDIPWGSNVETAMDVLPNYNDAYSTPAPIDPIRKMIDYQRVDDWEYVSAGHWLRYFSNVVAAGYKMTHLQVYFVYPVEDMRIVKDPDLAKMYAAQYYFEPKDKDGTYQDLKDKLTSKYGECDEEVTNEGMLPLDKKTDAVWFGKNNTELILRRYDNSSPSLDGWIELWYVWLDAEPLIELTNEAYKATLLAEEQEAHGNGDTSGL